MHRAFLFVLCALGPLGSGAALKAQATAPSLEQTFRQPPDDARVEARWWWFGAGVTKPELQHEMEQMKQGGFGGFEIQPVYPLALDDPKTGFRNAPYLSDTFLDDVRFVNTEAHRLGLRVNLTLASGWPYGGPDTPVTEAAGALRLVRMPVVAGEHSVAAPSVGNGEKLLGVFLADASWGESQTGAASGNAPAMLPLPASGSTRLQLPGNAAPGATVLWFVSSRTGQQVKRAAVGAEGFVLDHFSQQAVADHLHNVADKLMTAFGDQPPYTVFSDSLEVFESDWTPDFLAAFRERRGYDLLPHLPELFSGSDSEEALAVRHDWGLTLTELVDANYLKPINDWALAHHTLFRSQTYGAPAVSLSSNALVSLPEGEGPQWQQFSFTRWATSASHVYGRPITSSETWTWLHSPPFRATPLDMKAEADRFFLQGINQLMAHGWPYSPASAGEPGWHFYAAGALNAHNPWWIVMPDVTRYMQRVSWILRQGEPANDVAVYLPEDDAYAHFTPGHVSLTALMPHWITPELTQAIEGAGYNFDYIDSAAIAARGIHYPVLILPDVDRISAATLQSIARYEQQGGKVIALERLPADAPGLASAASESARVKAEAAALFHGAGPGAAYLPDVSGIAEALHRMAPPDMTLATPSPEVGFIHRKLPHADIYFVANTGNQPVHTSARFRSRRPFGEWLDADTGASRTMKSTSELTLDLPPYGSQILVFTDHAAASAGGVNPEEITNATTPVAGLSAGWQVRFAGTGAPKTMDTPQSWAAKPSTRYYSGVATYRKSIQLASQPRDGERFFLDFGKGEPLPTPPGSRAHPGMQALFDPPIREAAVVFINGKRAGSLWHPPYSLDVTALLKPGANSIEVQVANTAINEMAGEAQPDHRLLWARYGKRFAPQDMDHLAPLPSGLLGKVQLLKENVR